MQNIASKNMLPKTNNNNINNNKNIKYEGVSPVRCYFNTTRQNDGIFFLRPFTYDILAICSGLAVGTVPNKRFFARYYDMKIEFSTAIIRHWRNLLRPTIKRTRCPTKGKEYQKIPLEQRLAIEF